MVLVAHTPMAPPSPGAASREETSAWQFHRRRQGDIQPQRQLLHLPLQRLHQVLVGLAVLCWGLLRVTLFCNL